MSLTETISSNANAHGLAIIITNDYAEPQPKLPPYHPPLDALPGTAVDGKNMSDAFLALKFVVHWEKNVSLGSFSKLIHEARCYQDYHKLEKYKCIAFVFSGHGNEGDLVYLQDGSQVSIGENIIAPFLPKESPNMGKLQKLFFFDACRGKQHTSTVEIPRGARPKGELDTSRGAKVIEKINVPEEGGFLVAYSTMPSYRAWEKEGEGGAWLQRLAKRIRESRCSIEDVLTAVNADLIRAGLRNAQQPEKLSRLNEVIFLHPTGSGPMQEAEAPCQSATCTSNDSNSTQRSGSGLFLTHITYPRESSRSHIAHYSKKPFDPQQRKPTIRRFEVGANPGELASLMNLASRYPESQQGAKGGMNAVWNAQRAQMRRESLAQPRPVSHIQTVPQSGTGTTKKSS